MPEPATASLPILYSFRRCPFAMRARMALYAAGISVELREVALKAKPAAMRAVSPKATVPVLVTPAAEILEESLDIMAWALEANDPNNWLAPDHADMRALIDHVDGPFKHHLDRYKYATRYDDADAEQHRDSGLAILTTQIAQRLIASPHLFGIQPSLADIAIFPFVRQFRIADPNWFDALDTPQLHSWLSGHMQSPLFTAIMGKHEPWRPGEEPVVFPPQPVQPPSAA